MLEEQTVAFTELVLNRLNFRCALACSGDSFVEWQCVSRTHNILEVSKLVTLFTLDLDSLAYCRKSKLIIQVKEGFAPLFKRKAC